MYLIETHAHLEFPIYQKRIEQIIQNSLKNGVQEIYIPSVDISSVVPSLGITKRYPQICKPMVGLHPVYVNTFWQKQLQNLEVFLQKEKFIAIGEIGIDLFHSTSFIEEQKAAFIHQLDWSLKYKLPVVIHCRKGFSTIKEIISRPKYQSKLKGIWHCFEGTIEEANWIIQNGFYIGIGGKLTFDNASNLRRVVKQIALEKIILETDSPYLTPKPHQGVFNEPAYILSIAKELAKVKETTLALITQITTQNLKALER